MSHRTEEKEARRHERERAQEEARRLEVRQRRRRLAGYGLIGLVAAGIVTFSLVGGGGSSSSAPAGAEGTGGSAAGSGAAVGQRAPEFALTDAVTGRTVRSSALARGKTLLFFSEGVNCQACMVQAAELGKDKGALARRGIRLISVTTDNPGDLAVAARQYGITTPLLADPTTGMSRAYGMLGHGGMGHATQDGHAFILVQDGKVVWHRAYQEMYVQTGRLMSDMAREKQA